MLTLFACSAEPAQSGNEAAEPTETSSSLDTATEAEEYTVKLWHTFTDEGIATSLEGLMQQVADENSGMTFKSTIYAFNDMNTVLILA